MFAPNEHVGWGSGEREEGDPQRDMHEQEAPLPGSLEPKLCHLWGRGGNPWKRWPCSKRVEPAPPVSRAQLASWPSPGLHSACPFSPGEAGRGHRGLANILGRAPGALSLGESPETSRWLGRAWPAGQHRAQLPFAAPCLSPEALRHNHLTVLGPPRPWVGHSTSQCLRGAVVCGTGAFVKP